MVEHESKDWTVVQGRPSLEDSAFPGRAWERENREKTGHSRAEPGIEKEQQKRQRRTLALSPEQRLERFMSLQAAAESTLAANPEALAAFHRRNLRQRTESRVRQLERQLLSNDSKDVAP